MLIPTGVPLSVCFSQWTYNIFTYILDLEIVIKDLLGTTHRI